MTDTATPDNPTPEQGTVTATTAQIRTALVRYRALAWITGVWLLMLVAKMIAEYGFGVKGYTWIAMAHGWIYFVYLICTVDLAIKVRWPIKKIITTAIAGTIPFLSFWFEHIRAREVKQNFALDQ